MQPATRVHDGGKLPELSEAVTEVSGELERTTRHFTFLLASALVRKSDVEELAKKKWPPAPRLAPATGLQ